MKPKPFKGPILSLSEKNRENLYIYIYCYPCVFFADYHYISRHILHDY